MASASSNRSPAWSAGATSAAAPVVIKASRGEIIADTGGCMACHVSGGLHVATGTDGRFHQVHQDPEGVGDMGGEDSRPG